MPETLVRGKRKLRTELLLMVGRGGVWIRGARWRPSSAGQCNGDNQVFTFSPPNEMGPAPNPLAASAEVGAEWSGCGKYCTGCNRIQYKKILNYLKLLKTKKIELVILREKAHEQAETWCISPRRACFSLPSRRIKAAAG